MSQSAPVIRGIKIEITPLSGLLYGLIPAGTQARYTMILDEKPLGRRMEAAWQQAFKVEGRLHLADPYPIITALRECFAYQGAFLSEDAGLVVIEVPRHRFAAPLPTFRCEAVREVVAKELTHLPRFSKTAA